MTDGFVRLPNWLLDDSDLTLQELAVYIVLLRFRDHKTGKCHPGMSTIADRARLSKRSVIRAISSLESRGMIRVERRSSVKENKPNVYHVATATETPEFVWETSSRGRRIPKRSNPSDSESPPSDSESPGPEKPSTPSDSESPPSDSESPHPVTRSHPNKNQENKNHEQAMRQAISNRPPEYSFDVSEDHATPKQLDYLNDLHIFLTEQIPDRRFRESWEKFTTTEASERISIYWNQMDRGRGGMWDSQVDEHHPAYEHLSLMGRMWISNGCVPDMLEIAS